MAYVSEMTLNDGEVVLIELSGEDPRAGVDRVARGSALSGAAETLQQALARVRPALDAVVSGTRSLASRPDTVTVSFGIKATTEAGVVIARAATEANFTVTVTWSSSPA